MRLTIVNGMRTVRLFTPDAVIDDRVTGGLKSGVEEHVAYLKKALSKVHLSQHAISTVLFELNGNNAQVALTARVRWWWILERKGNRCSSRDCGTATPLSALVKAGK